MRKESRDKKHSRDKKQSRGKNKIKPSADKPATDTPAADTPVIDKPKIKLPSMDVMRKKVLRGKTQPVLLFSKLKSYVKDTHTYLDSLSKDEFMELESQVMKRTFDSTYVNTVEDLLMSLVKESKKDVPLQIKTVKPVKGPHPCFPDYIIDREIGSGFHGKVFLATKDGKQYSIKERTTKNKYNDMYKNDNVPCMNEIKIATEMGRLGIGPKVYDSYQCKHKNETKVYLVMEYMSEGDLKGWLNENQLSSKHKKQIQDKINKMHQLFIFHGDLHINNIFVNKEKGKLQFYIGDFGMSMMGQDGVRSKLGRMDTSMFTNSLFYQKQTRFNPLIARLLILWKLV